MAKGLVNYWFEVVDHNGVPIPSGLSVTITNSAGTTLTIYKQDESTSLTNPILSAAMDETGVADFWYASGGVYALINDGYNITRYGPIYQYDHRVVVPYLSLAGGAGTSSSSPIDYDRVDQKFIQYFVRNSAASGDNRLMYLRYELDGGAGGESFRTQTIISADAGTAHGAHIGLTLNGGSLSGLGVAGRNTLLIGNAALDAGGTYAAVQAEIWSDGASSSPSAVTELSFLKCTAGGNATGAAAVDDKAYLMVLDGIAEGAGNMVVASATEANYASAARCKINGVEKWLMFASASG